MVRHPTSTGTVMVADEPRARRLSVYTLLALATVALGLASRRYPSALPTFVASYAGDTLWASLVYFLVAIVRPRASVATLAAATIGISFAVEVSQLYHAPWIDAVRSTRLGGLVLGFGFLRSDLACYIVGVCFAAAIDASLSARRPPP